jgi:SM-20-related protein
MISKFDAVADGLAENGFAIVDNFLAAHEVNDILSSDEFQHKAGHFKKAGIGKHQDRQINEAVRGDHIQWLDKNLAPIPIKIYLERLSELTLFLNQSLFLSLKDFEVHMTVYPAGTFYKRHLDQFKKDDHRKLSVILYLNNNWAEEHGGQLRMYLPERSLDVLPIAGRLVCFRSDKIEHEVLPATRERFSLTGWMLDQQTELRYL